ncbi:hypothetical protein Vadar_019811 [Vaccinium darrowii]|uniref:Uncharacterized protein n=1 Tax=Vaccinium darrowii TaxID=229202 RepID=A0ACB7XB37_9ERIC|nr:hypothetical protein Vadar_019811 [Vaccinium darrowii]
MAKPVMDGGRDVRFELGVKFSEEFWMVKEAGLGDECKGELYVRSGEEGLVGVPEHTGVVPDSDPFRPGAPFDYICRSVTNTFLTGSSREVAAAEEEAIGYVWGAAAGSEIVKAIGSVGVGVENG